MLSINNFLTDFLYGYGYEYKPKDKDVINRGGESERDIKINNLIEKITGDGNNNETKKIVSIKVIPQLNNIKKEEKNESINLSFYKNVDNKNNPLNIHQYYSPTNDIM